MTRRERRRLNVALGDALHTAADLYALYLAADSRADRVRIAREISATEAVIRQNVGGK